MAGSGEVRAFAAVRLGNLSWVVDLVPNYELRIGSAHDADVRIDVPGVGDQHAKLVWDGAQVRVQDLGTGNPVLVNDEPAGEERDVMPGEELHIGPATLVVGITVAPVSQQGRRSLTHHEFCERLAEELERANRAGRPTSVVMMKTNSGDGHAVSMAALSSFRPGDVVGTYAHDEIEFLLPDTPGGIARAVIERLMETAGNQGASVGLAIAPEDGESPERVLRASRDALARALEEGGIQRPEASVPQTASSEAHTNATKLLIQDITEAAQGDEPVLLLGEPNSGKRYYARLLHDRSTRAEGPFVMIPCAGLLDAEAVTAAFGPKGQEGQEGSTAAQARGGTLLLDEVGDLPVEGQRRLLALLEREPETIRFVSTTHRDLETLAQHGAFLKELHERLVRKRIGIPALRFRAESILPLAQGFAQEFRPDSEVKLSRAAIEKMRSYSWPGNVLELRNAMERAIHLADGGEILAEHLPGETGGDAGRLRDHVGSVEREAIVKALADNNYNQTHAARALGISRRALIYKMEKYGLKSPPSATRGKSDPPEHT